MLSIFSNQHVIRIAHKLKHIIHIFGILDIASKEVRFDIITHTLIPIYFSETVPSNLPSQNNYAAKAITSVTKWIMPLTYTALPKLN